MQKTNVIKRTAGYTIDQTILIVAVIAVLITLVIASVGWDILNRTSGTKLASNVRQIEESVGQFRARASMWPHIALGNGDMITANIQALQDPAGAGIADADIIARLSNYLPSLENVAGAVQHPFGAGGDVVGGPSTGAAAVAAIGAGSCGNDVYFVIGMEDVPITEVLEADDAIDGTIDGAAGRIHYAAAVNNVTDVYYCGNLL